MENTSCVIAETSPYPQWVQGMMEETKHAAGAVAGHEAWRLFANDAIPPKQHQALLYGFWPLIDRFPHFIALNLCKCPYGRHPVLSLARKWLIKNIRVEQRHAEWYKDWAESAGVAMDTFFDGPRCTEAKALTGWCWQVCQSDDLAVGMAVIHYAIEGVTGEWTRLVGASMKYRALFPEHERRRAMQWLDAHAAYATSHPAEALDIIAGLIGPDPHPATVRGITDAVQSSYDLYIRLLDTCLDES